MEIRKSVRKGFGDLYNNIGDIPQFKKSENASTSAASTYIEKKNNNEKNRLDKFFSPTKNIFQKTIESFEELSCSLVSSLENVFKPLFNDMIEEHDILLELIKKDLKEIKINKYDEFSKFVQKNIENDKFGEIYYLILMKNIKHLLLKEVDLKILEATKFYLQFISSVINAIGKSIFKNSDNIDSITLLVVCATFDALMIIGIKQHDYCSLFPEVGITFWFYYNWNKIKGKIDNIKLIDNKLFDNIKNYLNLINSKDDNNIEFLDRLDKSNLIEILISSIRSRLYEQLNMDSYVRKSLKKLFEYPSDQYLDYFSDNNDRTIRDLWNEFIINKNNDKIKILIPNYELSLGLIKTEEYTEKYKLDIGKDDFRILYITSLIIKTIEGKNESNDSIEYIALTEMSNILCKLYDNHKDKINIKSSELTKFLIQLPVVASLPYSSGLWHHCTTRFEGIDNKNEEDSVENYVMPWVDNIYIDYKFSLIHKKYDKLYKNSDNIFKNKNELKKILKEICEWDISDVKINLDLNIEKIGLKHEPLKEKEKKNIKCKICKRVHVSEDNKFVTKTFPQQLVRWNDGKLERLYRWMVCEECHGPEYVAISHPWNVASRTKIGGVVDPNVYKWLRNHEGIYAFIDQLCLMDLDKEKNYMSEYYGRAKTVYIIPATPIHEDKRLTYANRLWCVLESLSAQKVIVVTECGTEIKDYELPWKKMTERRLAVILPSLNVGEAGDMDKLLAQFRFELNPALLLKIPTKRSMEYGKCWAPDMPWDAINKIENKLIENDKIEDQHKIGKVKCKVTPDGIIIKAKTYKDKVNNKTIIWITGLEVGYYVDVWQGKYHIHRNPNNNTERNYIDIEYLNSKDLLQGFEREIIIG
jgi:hypothetical protein